MSPLCNSGSTNTFNAQQNNNLVSQTSQSRVSHLRRQDSSYGSSHVHNMAVMVTPNRIDYSVTKGGIRSWVVLIVFLLLCLSIVTIFSDNKEESENEEISIIFEDKNNEDVTLETNDKDQNLNEDEDENDNIDIEEFMLSKLKEKANSQSSKNNQVKEEKKTVKTDDFNTNNDKRNEDNSKVETKEEKIDEDDNEFENLNTDLNTIKKIYNNEIKKKDVKPDIFLKRKKKFEKRQRRLESKNILQPKTSIQAQKLATDVLNPRKTLLKTKKNKNVSNNFLELKEEVDYKEDENEPIENNNDYNNDNDVNFKREEIEKNFNELQTFPNKLYAFKKLSIYDHKTITNKADYKYRRQLDLADSKLKKHDFSEALKIYKEILSYSKNSPRAHFGIGRINQLKSEFSDNNEFEEVKKDNKLIENAINNYQKVLDNRYTPDELFRLTSKNLVECARWSANLHKVLTVQRGLIDKFPNEAIFQVDFGITFLQMSRYEDAKKIFLNVLKIDPSNNVAQAYYGYILKTHDNDFEKGAYWMRKGLRNSKSPFIDSKFYFHLGDALTHLGREQEALKIYKKGVELGFFPSVFQRSMHNLKGLIAQPWWSLNQSGCSKQLRNLERHWTIIREEALNAWNENRLLFQNENMYLLDGNEKIIYLQKESQFLQNKCLYFPNTCKILKEFFQETFCGKDEIKISILFAGSRIWPHCAPTNYEIEAHLGLIVPSEARIRVAQEIRGWKTGHFIIFDKSFEHEIWFDGAAANAMRFILSINLWHPQVPQSFKNKKEN